MEKIVITIMIYFTIVSISYGQTKEKLTLEECYSLAEENLPTKKTYSIYEEQNRLEEKIIKSVYLPKMILNTEVKYLSDVTKLDLDLPANLSNSIKIETPSKEQYQAYIDIKQLIYDGGVSNIQRKISKNKKELNHRMVNSTLYNTRSDVNRYFFSILLLRQSLKTFRNMKEVLCENKKVVESCIKNGIAVKSDIDQIDSEIIKLEQKISENEIIENSIRKSLEEMLNITTTIETEFELPKFDLNKSTVYKRPEFEILKTQSKLFDLNIKQLNSTLRPKAFGFGRAGYGKPGLNMLKDELSPFYILGVGASWKIYDWQETKHKKNIYRLQKRLVETRSETLKQQIRIKSATIKGEIARFDDMIKKDKRLIELLESISARTASELKNGVSKTSDYIRDFNAVVNAKISMETHKIRSVQQKVNYRFLTGE